MKMYKLFWSGLLIASLLANALPVLAATHSEELTEIEKQQASEVAIQFTKRLAETSDLSLLVKDLYLNDSVERFKRDRSKRLEGSSDHDVYFVPGLDYNSRLLTDGSTEDWYRFYIAANNFLFFGFMSGIKNYSGDGKDFKPTDMYPSSVIKLLDSNPNLANMILRKGSSRPVSSVDEMKKATATLEQAAAMIRKKQNGKALLNINAGELIKLMKEDELFRPQLEIVADEVFGFPQGTRLVYISTPLGFRLTLVKSDNRLKIVWAEPYALD
jgi:hypothetical protein